MKNSFSESKTKVQPDFFLTPTRQSLLKNIAADDEKKQVLAVLTGNDGSGKSSLCRLLAKHPAKRQVAVLVTNPSGSFDDLVLEINEAVDLLYPEPADDAEAAAVPTHSPPIALSELRRRLLFLKNHGLRLFVIIDQAERMFFATMERLQELVKLSISEGHCLSLLLVGNEQLQDNLRQISLSPLCAAVQARHLMPDIQPEELKDFLNAAIQAHIAKMNGAAPVFSQDFIAQVLSAGQGRAGTIIRLLEDKTDTRTDAPLSLPPSTATKRFVSFTGLQDFLQRFRVLGHEPWIYFFLVTPVAGVLFLFAFFPGTMVEKAAVPKDSGHVSMEISKTETQKTFMAGPAAEEKNIRKVPTAPPAAEKPPEARPVSIQKGDEGENSARAKVLPQEIKEKTKKVTISSLQTQSAPLIKTRVVATRRWARRADRASYTMQIMLLQAEAARMNLEQDLNHSAVRPLLKQIYIFEKKGQPSSLFVFLGEYQTRKEALAAKAALPVVLARNKPYLLTVDKALDKAR